MRIPQAVTFLFMATWGCGSSSDPRPQATLAYEEFSDLPGVNRVVRVAADGSHRKILWEGEKLLSELYAGPDGRMLVWADEGWILLTPDGAATPFAAPTVDGATSLYLPLWSPDGGTIAWSLAYSDEIRTKSSVVLAPPGSSSAQFFLPDSLDVLKANWSPDSRQLVICVRPTDFSLALFVIDRDGANLHRIVADTMLDGCHASWSSSNQIAFTGRGTIFTVAPDGTGLKEVVLAGGPRFEALRGETFWAPEGPEVSTSDDGELMWRVDVTDGANTKFSRKAPYQSPWAPDGSRLTYRSDTTRIVDGVPVGHYTIGVIRPDGTEPRTITSDSVSSHYPVWLPDAS